MGKWVKVKGVFVMDFHFTAYYWIRAGLGLDKRLSGENKVSVTTFSFHSILLDSYGWSTVRYFGFELQLFHEKDSLPSLISKRA